MRLLRIVGGFLFIMKKDAYYFPHDSNARNDEKILFLRSKFGLQGYGMYWVLIELMHESQNSWLSIALVQGIAHQYGMDKEQIEAFLEMCFEIDLFVQEDGKYTSIRVLRNKDVREEKKTLRSRAGKIGMASRWNNNVITKDNTPITEYNKGKEIKGKEIKVKEINIPFDVFWIDYDKKVGDRTKLSKKWENLSDEERIKAIEHIKVYKLAVEDKQFRKNPETYLNNKSWNDEIINRTFATGNTSEQRIDRLKNWVNS